MCVILKIAREQFKSLNSRPTDKPDLLCYYHGKEGVPGSSPGGGSILIGYRNDRWSKDQRFFVYPSGGIYQN